MKQKNIYLIIICTLIIIILSLFLIKNANDSTNHTDDTHLSQTQDKLCESLMTDDIIENNDFYSIYRYDEMVCCCFYDRDGNTVKTEGPFSKIPEIKTLEKNLILFTMQSGTDIATQWGFFYDFEKGVFSKEFQSIAAQANGMVACIKHNGVIVSSIFNENAYYREFLEFENPFSDSAAPIIDVKFINDATGIEITYLTSEDYNQITEQFVLD